MSAPRPRSICYVINNVAFFASHRLPIATAAQARGHHVRLLTGHGGSEAMESEGERRVDAAGIERMRVDFTADGMNPLKELRGVLQIARWFWKLRPELVHCASPKGVLYGGLASRIVPPHALVISVSGMGYAFTPGARTSLKRQLIGGLYKVLSRLAYGHRNKRVVVQNMDDERYVVEVGWARADEVIRIPGSGIDLDLFVQAPIERKQDLVVLPARLLADKGVHEFVAACRRLREACPGWRFMLAGSADYQNPSAISRDQAQAWHDEGVIEWAGHVADMPGLLAQTSIVCLPSYREGMPKSLLEAAAAGCAVITTDTTGCREAIIPGETGDLVPARDADALADALLQLIRDPARRHRYGVAGRQLAIDRFSIESVIATTLATYSDLCRHESTDAR
ncbi:glycosyltransferase family 4 protein [Leptothrix discophora]|uniref:Glycosyltransferase family 4 protein n=1 Tax=Leptothrix discophora TaxID=89 RepID=A0ABT9G041_LEPDI|nr:glycosyltransferase family 4 protein [Leptothrix discophora]MDP4299848.1 glycosyltransferase family 4 protein [Leptothrix discophora]